MLKQFLFRMAKGPFMGKMVGTAFQFCSWAIPVKKVPSVREVMAFRHPQPSFENHLILSPKRAVRNLQQLAEERFCGYFVKIYETAMNLCETRSEYRDAFVLVANGGKRQEVQQVHFHMFTNCEVVNDYAAKERAEAAAYSDGSVCLLKHPNPNWELHFVAKPVSPSRVAEHERSKAAYFRSVLQCIDFLNEQYDLVQRGYSLVYQYDRRRGEQACPVFHITAGKRLS